jgi:hypothetical protein
MPEFVLEKLAVKMLFKGIAAVLLIAALAYPVDWAVWKVRVAAGHGMGSMQVDMYTVAELKGGKEDYYPDGTTMMACSKSLYPQGGNDPCWWVERHRQMINRY